MPQIDKVTFYYVTFWFILMFVVFYTFLYLTAMVPVLNINKVYLKTIINKLGIVTTIVLL